MQSRLNDLKNRLMTQSKASNTSKLTAFSRATTVVVLLLISALTGRAQGWELAFGGNAEDQGLSIIQTNDQGYLVVGISESFGEDNDLDVYIIRTDVDGTLLWEREIDEGIIEHGYTAIETEDGGFLIAGDILRNVGEQFNAYLLKVDKTGKFEWSKSYGDISIPEQAFDICKTDDGGYALIGRRITEDNQEDILVIRVDEDGNELWTKTYGQEFDEIGTAIIGIDDGFWMLGNIKDGDFSNGDFDIYLSKIDLDGNLIWADTILQTEDEEQGLDLILTESQELVFSGFADNGTQAFIAKYSLNGDSIWHRSAELGQDNQFITLTEDYQHNIVTAGITNFNDGNTDILLAKYSPDGTELLLKNIGNDVAGNSVFNVVTDIASGIAATVDGGYIVTGHSAIGILNFINDVTLTKVDVNGNSYTNFIEGKVYADESEDCSGFAPGDMLLEDYLIIAKGTTQTFVGTSDAEGNYKIRVDTGTYQVDVVLQNNYWELCEDAGYVVNFSEFYDTTTQIDFPIIRGIECPYLEVDISAEFLTVCSDIDYTVAYCNLGTSLAGNSYTDVTLDDELTFNSSSVPGTLLTGPQDPPNTYRFELGGLSPTDCGSFTINASMDCNGIATGQAGLVSAHIYPDSICTTPGPDWDGASIIVTGVCLNDSITFEIKNVGDGDMDSDLQFFIVEDDLMFFQGSFDLDSDSTLVQKAPKNGATFRIVAEQSPDHPGMSNPTIAIEGCTLEPGDNYSTGYYTQLPENDQDPFIAIDVQEINIENSSDKVLLRGYPKGYQNLIITPNTDLTYIISFQNLGTDTISRIVIRDTLSSHLDIGKIIPGSSSHPYDYEVYNNGILKITFNEIQLQPSGSTEEALTRGFVKFRIAQEPNNPVGTTIENSATVFFDYHEPVQTKIVRHEVGCEDFFDFDIEESCIITSTYNPDLPEGIKIKVYPNPFFEKATIEVDGNVTGVKEFTVYDVQGRLVKRSYFERSQFEFYRNDLPAGLYFYKLAFEGQLINSGKIVVR